MKGVQGAIHFDVTGDETDLENALARSRSSLIASGRTAEQEGAKIEQMFKRAASGVLAFFTVSKATDFVKSMATVHGEFQSIQIALSTILGSEERAVRLFAQLKDTAVKTPFDMKSIAQGAKQLIAYGESADTVNDTLIKLGNVAAGLSIPLGDLVYLYGTTMTQGRIYTQDLNQFTGRGIPMIRELAKELGVAESEVRGLVEAGKVGFPEVQKVIESLTDKGGMFFNMMPRMSEAVTGQISNLEDAWASALDGMGRANEGFLYSGIEGATYLIKHYDAVLKTIGMLVAAYGSYKAALIVVNTIQKSSAFIENIRLIAMCRKELGLATAAQQAFNLSVKVNPYVLAISALLTVISALAIFSGGADKAAEAQAELNKSINEETKKLDELYRSITKAKEGTTERKDAIDSFNSEYGKYLSNLITEKSSVDELTTAYNEAKKSVVEFQIAKAKSSFLEEPLEDLTKTTTRFYKQLGDWTKELKTPEQQGRFTAYVDQVLDDIKNGGSFSLEKIYDAFRAAQAKQSYKSVEDWKTAMRGGNESFGESNIDIINRVGGWDTNDIDFLGKGIQRLQVVMNNAESDFEKFSSTYSDVLNPDSDSSNNGSAKLKTFSEQVSETRNNIATLTQELKDLRAGNGEGITNWSKAIEDKEKELKAAQDSYNTMLGIKPDKKDGTTTSPEDYKTRISNESRELQRLYEDLELSIQKARIDAMDEGLDKVLMTNELNHKVEIAAIERQKEDTLRKIQDGERTIWESQNPDWKKKGLTFTPTTTELPENIVAQFDSLTKSANDRAILNNKNALDEMLADFATYEQSRDKIREDFEKKRKSMYNEDGTTLKSGFTQGNVDELNRSEKEAYEAVDEQFAMREETYQAWMDWIANMTVEQLKQTLADAKTALAEAEESGVGGSKLAEAKSKVTKAEKAVSKTQAKNEVSPNKRSIKEWEDLYKTLQEVEREFESIGDTVGGVAGEIISTAGQIATSSLSMINGIMQLTTTATTGATAAATASATAIQTVEKASIILTIISAAMQIAMTIINLFNNDKAYQKEIENLQERIDQLQWELDNEESVRLGKSIDILNTVRKTYSEVTTEVLKLHAAEIMRGNFLYRMIAPVTYQNEILQKSAENLAVAYANIKYTADKALGSAKYNEAEDKLRNIAQQQLLMQEQIRNEDAKKKTDHGKIADWERQIIELGEEANKIINEIVEDILGGSAADLAKDLGDAFIDAFQAGEDAAEAWGDKVDDIVANVIKQMLVSKYLEEPLGAIFDKYKSKWYKDGQFAGIDAIMESMNGFASDLNGVGDKFKVIWDNLPDSIKNLLPVSDDDSREASERGIATASQESVDENNGRLTTIQGHTYSLNENVKTLVVIGDKTLEATNAIRDNTAHCKRLENMEKDIKSIKTKLDDIDDSGMKIK